MCVSRCEALPHAKEDLLRSQSEKGCCSAENEGSAILFKGKLFDFSDSSDDYGNRRPFLSLATGGKEGEREEMGGERGEGKGRGGGERERENGVMKFTSQPSI